MNRMYRKVADSKRGEYKHGSKSQIDKLEVEESMPSRFSDSRRVKDDEDYVEEPDTLIMIDGEEISYDMKCYDGYAIGKCNVVDEDIPEIIKMTYPKKSELYEDEIEEILIYRGLKGSVSPEDITYGDIMMAMGELESEYVGVSDSCKRVKDEVDLNNPDANEWILMSIKFPFDEDLFRQFYEDDVWNEGFKDDENFDYDTLTSDLITDMAGVAEDELCKGVAKFFGQEVSYYHGDQDLIVELRGAANEFRDKIAELLKYAEDIEIHYDDIFFVINSSNNDVWELFGRNIVDALEAKFGSDDKTWFIAHSLVGVYCMDCVCIYNNVPYLQDLVNEDDVREIIR